MHTLSTELSLLLVIGALLVSATQASSIRDQVEKRSVLKVCAQISNAISSASEVFYNPSPQYLADIAHWASSSTQLPACSVEPGTAADVGKILQIVGNTRTPFAVKGGGHATNPGFSSTTAVHVSMSRFSQVTYDASSQTATLGAGLIWDDVYAALAPYNVNVVGGRVSGIGIAGFTLGGGYSWLTNQYGLTIDTVTAFELVLPNGDVQTITEASNDSLFFALKGGGNNFGIVTAFTLQTFPQAQVWGGVITTTEQYLDLVNNATSTFCSSVTDQKAAIITTYNYVLGEPGVSQLLFYDGPTPPEGIFDQFLAIPFFSKDVSTRSFLSLVQSSPSNATYGYRGVFDSVPIVQYTPSLLNVILNETTYWGDHLSLSSGFLFSYDVEPFLTTILYHGRSSAYPPTRANRYLPLNLYFAWTLETEDSAFQNAIIASAANIRAQAEAEGQDIANAPVYSNYAIFSTSLQAIYGDNVGTLETLKHSVDPSNIMGLAGGFKF